MTREEVGGFILALLQVDPLQPSWSGREYKVVGCVGCIIKSRNIQYAIALLTGRYYICIDTCIDTSPLFLLGIILIQSCASPTSCRMFLRMFSLLKTNH
mmetsp:Transcript_14590/g.32056  ORF Transcript_14590/g.32056 Transcript_14590/m.32056 type:complete len:99 (+) Transcript_14590:1274-1570(+)